MIPPSVVLAGAAGTLAWTVEARGGEVHVAGRSPKWTVTHVAAADLTPRRTTRTADGVTVTVEYGPSGAVFRGPSGEVRVDRPGLWDGDTLDVRLGYALANGEVPASFSAIDTANGKVYDFATETVGRETCGAVACTHLEVHLTGMLRYLGPTWQYWYDAGGRLVRFEGPMGRFEVTP